MNYFTHEYDPLRAMQGGMQLYQGMEGAYDRQLARPYVQQERDVGLQRMQEEMLQSQLQRRMQEEELQKAARKRNALARMGATERLAGLEEEEGAIRQPWLRDLYASGDAELAFKGEELASAPFRVARDARKAGEMEREKLAARTDAWGKMMPALFGQQTGHQNSLAQPVSVGISTDQGVLPPGGGVLVNPQDVGGLARAMSGEGLGALSGDTTQWEFDLEHGPKMKHMPMSPLDAELKRREAVLKGRETELKAEDLEEKRDENVRTDLRSVQSRIADLTKEKKELEKDRAAGNIAPQDYRAQKSAIEEELGLAKSHRERLLRGTPAGERQAQLSPADQEKLAQAKAASSQGKPPQPSPPRAAQVPTAQREEVGAGLPYKMQQDMKAKVMQRDIEKGQDVILAAQEKAEKHAKHYQTGKDLLNLLATKDVGSPWAKIPGGNMAATIMSDDHDRLDKWRNELIDTMKQEGQSQLMNTLPELAIVSSELPSIENRPDLNREAIAKVMSKYEAQMVAPKFLEDWAHAHGGSLTGSRQVFRDWMKHNQKYTIEKQGGKSQIYENDVMPLDAWAKLSKDMPAQEITRRLQTGKLKVINGRVFAQ